MSTQLTLVPAGATTAIFAVTPQMSVMAAPQVLGGTMTVFTGPTPSGPWSQWSAGASGNAASVRSSLNAYVYATAATQAGILAISDIGAGQGNNPLNEPLLNVQAVMASPSSAAEVALASWRIPPLFLRPNFRMWIRGAASFSNNINVKTLNMRMNGIAGTLVFQNALLASNLNFRFDAAIVGIGDGATLKGLGAGSSSGLGLSTVAFTTLARDYINNETEFVVSCLKATPADMFQLDALEVYLYQ